MSDDLKRRRWRTAPLIIGFVGFFAIYLVVTLVTTNNWAAIGEYFGDRP